MFLLQIDAVRLLLRGLGLGVLSALLALGLQSVGALSPLERGSSNALFRLRGPRAPQSRIFLLVIDQETATRAGRMPLPRRYYTQTLQRLRSEGARVIGFNFVFGTRSEDPRQDALLAREIGLKNDVTQGLIFDAPGAASDARTLKLLPSFALLDRGAGARGALSVAAPLFAMASPQSGMGHLNFRPEPGGEVRRVPHLIRFGERVYPSLALSMAIRARGQSANTWIASRGQIESPDGIAVPIDANGETLINWLGGEGTFERLSMARLLDGLVPRGALRGATVLIGEGRTATYAPVSTPFSHSSLNSLSALDLQANAYDDIISNRVLRLLPWGFQAGILAACSLGAGAVLARRGAWGTLGWTFLTSLALWSVGVIALFANLSVSLAAPQVALVLTGAACLGVRQVRDAGELRRLHEVFSGYVGNDLLKLIKTHKPKLDGELRYVAVLFCDIRGFSGLAEKLSDEPERLLRLLNDHFDPIIGSLQGHGAHVDNFAGDMVMAIFGAPISEQASDRNTRSAVLAAIDVLRIVARRNMEREQAGEPHIEVGIGIHCGPAVVGDLGIKSRKHYTAIGDTVNISSRVEGETRPYQTRFLVTEEVMRACTDHPDTSHLTWRFVAETSIRGRQSAVKLFSLPEFDL